MIVEVTGGVAYSAEAKALINFTSKAELFEAADNPVTVNDGKAAFKVAPWGSNNDLPQIVMEKIRRSDVVGSNLLFNIQTAYGLGIKPMMRVGANKDGSPIFEDCQDPEVLAFFEDNDIEGYFLEQISDMFTFFNNCVEVMLNPDGNKIVSLRHLEATHSRWGCIEKGAPGITKHYYSIWKDGQPDKTQLTVTPVLSRFNTCANLEEMVKVSRSNRRFVMQISMPTPGRTYYAHPYWWSIFESGWYDLSIMLPMFKKALIKNELAVRYIVYIADEFWQEAAKRENISPADGEKMKELREREVKKITDFLSAEQSKGGTIIAPKKMMPSGNSVIDNKWIEIVPVDSKVKGGEFLEDAEEASNIISYAMGVHPNLNGATPGKGRSSMGGTDKRELFMIKQALIKPFRDRLLKPLLLVKKFNKWPENLVFAVPEYAFTTLDKNKTGKEESVQA